MSIQTTVKRFSQSHGKRPAEANVQAYLFMKCYENGLNCYLDHLVQTKRKHQLDAVIFDDSNNIICVIEVKSYKTERPGNRETKQLAKYKALGYPVYLLACFNDVDYSS